MELSLPFLWTVPYTTVAHLPNCVPSTALCQLDSGTCNNCMDCFNAHSTICLRMHSKLCDELSSHAHAHANTLTVEIISNARVSSKALMRVPYVSVFCIWPAVWLNYHSSVHCSFWLLNHALLCKIPALIVREYTTTINAHITLKWKQRRNNGCLHGTSINEVDCAVP